MMLIFAVFLIIQSTVFGDEEELCEHVLYVNAGPMDAVKDTEIARIDIGDHMVYEMDVEVNSLPSGPWGNVFHCGASDSIRKPGIWLHPSSGDENNDFVGFHFSFSTDTNTNPWINPGPPIVSGGSYHLVMSWTQTSLKVEVNGNVEYFNENYEGHANDADQACYISDPWFDAADVVVSNVKIASYDECVCRNVIFQQDDAFTPSKSNELTRINIVDEMDFIMDIKVNAIPATWESVFHCGTSNENRQPGIWTHPEADEEGKTFQGFHFIFSHNVDNPWNNPGPALVIGETYHIEMAITQNSLTILVNDALEFFDGNYGSHTNNQNIPCYAGDPWFEAAAVEISNLVIYNGGIEDCECPRNFEYDYEQEECIRDCSKFAFDEYLDTCSTIYPAHLAASSASIAELEASIGDVDDAVTQITDTTIPGMNIRIDDVVASVGDLGDDVKVKIENAVEELNNRIENNKKEIAALGLGELGAAYAQPGPVEAIAMPTTTTTTYVGYKDEIIIGLLLMNMITIMVSCYRGSKKKKYRVLSMESDEETAALRR